MNMRRMMLVAIPWMLMAAVATAQQREDPKAEIASEKQVALLTAARDSFVIVEYTLQYDKGEAPHGQFSGEDVETIVREERPYERPGILVDATHVVTTDLQVHPRFIKGIRVRRPGESAVDVAGAKQPGVGARIGSYPRQHDALVLDLEGTLAGAKPAAFEPKSAPPLFVVGMTESEARWVLQAKPFAGDVLLDGEKRLFESEEGLVVDKQGHAVTVATGMEMPLDDSWRVAPGQWPAFTAQAMGELLSTVEKRASRGIVAVTLNLRSPRNKAMAESFEDRTQHDATVKHVLGVALDDHTVLVLAELKPAVTARLERIRIMSDPPMDATFTASLKDYGAFVARTQKPLEGAAGLSQADIRTLRWAALPAADISVQGEQRVAYFQPRRIEGFTTGWRGNIYPQLPTRDDKDAFLFDQEGKLLALPVSVREKASTAERYRNTEAQITPVAQLGKALASLKESADPGNVPLSEEQENRLAWMGVELQGMTPELARANHVSDQTSDGQSGGLVTYVYPDSPAAKAGVEPGWILLRLDVPGQPRPIEVHAEADRFGGEPFPWDRLADAPEQVFDRIPTPWPPVENELQRTLTDQGFGTRYQAEFAHDGKIEKKDFSVVQGPAHYESAPKYKHAGLGLTLRDMTYEVRRYMQRKNDEPGVVISKIELGSKASIAGLKPYEVITHVNDQPVMNVGDFERLSKDQTELRLSVKRMTTGRIVKVSLPAAGTQPQ
jgi:hypothetical protein